MDNLHAHCTHVLRIVFVHSIAERKKNLISKKRGRGEKGEEGGQRRGRRRRRKREEKEERYEPSTSEGT